MTEYFNQAEACAEKVIAELGPHIRLGMPLGLGKPAQWVNALYQKVKQDASLRLDIYTALSLEVPAAASSLQKRFLQPFYARVFDDYQGLDYLRDLRQKQLPGNIRVYEFFIKSGGYLNNTIVQQHYLSCNYAHVSRDLMRYNINVIAQIIAVDDSQEKPYSLSCNPDISLELLPWLQQKKRAGEKVLVVGQTHHRLPYMPNDAALAASDFDCIVDNRDYDTQLFSAPDLPLTATDYLIGLYASVLIRDGGTLQIGIGSLSDSIVYVSQLRHEKTAAYQSMLASLDIVQRYQPLIAEAGGIDKFVSGLYGCSEMFVDGFINLLESNILRRKVYPDLDLQRAINRLEAEQLAKGNGTSIRPGRALLDALRALGRLPSSLGQEELDWLIGYGIFHSDVSLQGDNLQRAGRTVARNDLTNDAALADISEHCCGDSLKQGVVIHGGFFLGPRDFYQKLREMPKPKLAEINMTRIGYINSLYGEQDLKFAQRQQARFFNTAFKVNLLGAATSDALADGRVVSGVGGQYNFVTQGNDLPGARSILLLRATRSKNGNTTSNIVWNYAHTTIPRHLRDIYITEYGIADCRGKSDAGVIKAMLNIADSRFQPGLLKQAKAAGKLEADYVIPSRYTNNTPDAAAGLLAPSYSQNLLPSFPFSCDFTEQELRLGKALRWLQERSESRLGLLALLVKNWSGSDEGYADLLERMELAVPQSLQEKAERVLVLAALKNTA